MSAALSVEAQLLLERLETTGALDLGNRQEVKDLCLEEGISRQVLRQVIAELERAELVGISELGLYVEPLKGNGPMAERELSRDAKRALLALRKHGEPKSNGRLFITLKQSEVSEALVPVFLDDHRLERAVQELCEAGLATDGGKGSLLLSR